MKNRPLAILMICLILTLSIMSCKHESSLANIPKLSDSYTVKTDMIDTSVKLEDRLTIDYPADWINGILYRDMEIGKIKGVGYDNHLELHGYINDFGSIVLVLTPITYLSYKDSLSEIKDIIPQNIEGINKEDVFVEDKGDYSILNYSDYIKAYVYKYDNKTTITIVSLLDSDASQQEINTLSNIVLGMMKSIKSVLTYPNK